ncbi:MAG: class I SAM-dependent methyltransferase [Dehalococcoidia bacterium]|nr:dTDP-3-amino-3,6-dideoxy-alpha-D-glucopyranose N,N-dimethyltransferase [Chloroflexota bacterium]MBT9161356.1 dTDP-3-amino-3,6-dideoxy-alpha-D-glucopyranose N,N-dimethyltransferase [Chloroflexota bacterium]
MKEDVYKSEYEGFSAEFYDILHSTAYDVPAYTNLAKEFGAPILELGCGTGRLLIPLAKSGFTVTGIDISEEMLAICRLKLDREGAEVKSRVSIVNADMRDFSLEKQFRFIFAACNTIHHLTTTEDLTNALHCVYKHLTKDGVFIVDNSVPDIASMVGSNGKEEISEYVHPVTGRRIVSHFKPTYDFLNQLEHDDIVLEEYEDAEIIRRISCKVTLTYFFPRELNIILQHCGFKVFKECGSFKGDPLTGSSNEMIFACYKV